MMKFFRKYNKHLLVGIMTLLMIVFMGGAALEGMFNTSGNRVVARSAEQTPPIDPHNFHRARCLGY